MKTEKKKGTKKGKIIKSQKIQPKDDPEALNKAIDISHYQNEAGGIDWSQIATPPVPSPSIKFVFIKITEGVTTIDPYGKTNATNANNSDVPFGYYHFAHPGKNAAYDEANSFYKQITTIGLTPTLNYPYALDLEVNHGLSPDDYLTWIHAFIERFYNRFSTPPPSILIYGSPGNLNSWLPSGHDLGGYPLWVSHYDVSSPDIPNGWSDYLIWQYTDKAAVPGIIGNVDADWAKSGIHG